MQISCDPILFFRDMVLEHTMSLTDWFRMAKSLDLAGTEIQHNCLDSYEPAYLEGIHRDLERYSLQVSQFITSPDFTSPDPSVRAAHVAKTKAAVDVAAFFGAQCLRVTAGQEYPGVSREQGVGWVTACFREVMECAKNKGVWVAYENHYKDFFWERPDFSRNHEVFLEIVDRLRDTPLRVNFDCSNSIVVGQNPVELLQLVADRVVHVHCNDRMAFGRYDHAVVGEGVVDIPGIFRVLKCADYDGWLSVEYNGNQGIEGLWRSIACVRQTWTEVK
jgi:sugar phosphate isomerase/epimerase